MAKLDTLLKKNPSSLKGGSQNMFIQVSSLRTELLRFRYFRVLFYHLFCYFLFSHLMCPFFLQLQQMGRCAVAESNTDNYNFFYHIAGEMVYLKNEPAEEKAAKARETIISNITEDKKYFTKVNLSCFRFINKIEKLSLLLILLLILVLKKEIFLSRVGLTNICTEPITTSFPTWRQSKWKGAMLMDVWL